MSDMVDLRGGYGNKAFGKSYLPGMGYVPANKVPKQVLRRAAKVRANDTPPEHYQSDRWTRHERRLKGKQSRFESRFEQGLYPNPVRVRGKDIGGRRTTDEKYRPKSGTKSSEMRQRNRLGEGGFAEPPLGRHYHLTGNKSVRKVDTTMSEHEAKHLAARYDTRGPLPKGLTREQKMKAYEARYVATGGKKAEKWHRRANAAEVGRNVGLAGATAGAALTLAARNPKAARHLKRAKITAHRADNATIGAAAFGGASELYGEHARSRRASYQNSPGGVAASALRRMQAYTPEKRKP